MYSIREKYEIAQTYARTMKYAVTLKGIALHIPVYVDQQQMDRKASRVYWHCSRNTASNIKTFENIRHKGTDYLMFSSSRSLWNISFEKSGLFSEALIYSFRVIFIILNLSSHYNDSVLLIL